jgi:hypothetical protein
MRPLGKWLPWDIADQVQFGDVEVRDYFRPAATLDWRHVRNCKVVPDRIALLTRYLRKGGIVAELGTDRGAFAEMIMTLP